MTTLTTTASPVTPLARSVRAELRRVLRWPVTWVLLGVWLLLNVLFTYVFDWISYRTGTATGPAEATTTVEGLLPAAVPDVLTQGMPLFGGALVMILAALAVGSGYGWGTWKTVYTQGPSRVAAFSGTLVALAVLVAGLVLVTIGVDLALSALIAVVEGQSAGLPSAGPLAVSAAGAMLILGMWASLGTAVGVLSRSPALSAGLGLVWSLVVENLLRGVANALPAIEGVTYRLPGSSAGSVAGALGATPVTDGGSPGVLTELSGLAATGLTAGYLLVGVVVALAVVARRDLL
ncbi:MAG TPA: ABC transporter permease [Mycobacteriales bacterium]